MPPIALSRDEFSSLKKIVAKPQPTGEIPDDHAEKFLNYGLAERHVMLICATPLGQLELLRQRFRGIELPKRIVLNDKTARGSLLFSGKRG